MSDEGEKSCPLCAEEMDLTDQQLKPCKCGYEICVWCWHHIMDMAQKDDTEGRCPACRSAYDREKVVGMASKCERLVAGINMEKKIKSQKANAKSSEGRRQLGTVRVIQRNLVYIVGLPLNLANEDLLQRREYFGQYGKVLKVSMSRAATGAIQQFPNNTCSVYITYSTEDEAIRCIQNVHQFVLEGKSLRACFGTTKYCHAWLRNVPCTNPDCLYLHEVGSQEDSFTKDEIISAYSRSRVQQITGASNNLQRRSGNMLPPLSDAYCNNGSAPAVKPVIKYALNSSGSILRDSPLNGSTTKSTTLPATASWGTRGSNCLPPAITLACSNVNVPVKLKSDTVSVTSAVSGASESSTLQDETGKKSIMNENEYAVAKSKIESLKPVTSLTSYCGSYLSERFDTHEKGSTSVTLSCQLSNLPESKYLKDTGMSRVTTSADFVEKSPNSNLESDRNIISDVHIINSSDTSSMGTDKDVEGENASGISRKTSVSDKDLIKAPGNHKGLQECFSEQFREPSVSTRAGKDVSLISGAICRDEYDWTSKFLKNVQNSSEEEEDLISFCSQRHNDPQVVSHSNYLPALTSSLSGYHSPVTNEAYRSIGLKDYSLSLDKEHSENSLLASNFPATADICSDNLLGSSVFSDNSVHSLWLPSGGRRHIGRFDRDISGADGNAHSDKGESSIISNILSMDYDVWNDSLTSQNLAKLLGETDKQSSSLIKACPWRSQNNNQSRFSFARQEESRIVDAIHSPLDAIGQLQKNKSSGFSISDDNARVDEFQINNGFCSANYEGSENHSGNQITNTLNKFSAFPRAQISAPPGFSAANRAAPPGFSSLERLDQASDSIAANHLQDTSSVSRNIYPASRAGNNVNSSDLDFMDPAILAVGKGRIQLGLSSPGLDTRSNFSSQSSSFESDPRVQFLMQRSLSSQQNLRFSDVRDGFNHVGDSYGLSSRLMDQSHVVKNLSPFGQLSFQHPRNGVMSNGVWDNGFDVHGGNNMGMADILRSDRLGFNNISGFEDSKFRMPSSGDLYNQTFGM